MSKKVVVLDTNVLLHDPEAPSSFGSDRIVLPIQVVEEIDRFKRDPSEKGRNSRRVARLLDGLRQRGNLADGVPLIPGGDGTLEVAFCRSETLAQLPPELQGGGGDNNILAVALEQMRSKGLADPPEVVLITKDTNLRIKADAVGLDAEDYSSDKVAIADLYPGARSVKVSASLIDELHHNGSLSVQALLPDAVASLQPNEGVMLVDAERPEHTFLSRQKGDSGELAPLAWLKRARLGRVKPRNREQSFALDLLLDPSVQLVTLVGKAGTGKTLLAIAAGLHQVADEHRYARLLVTRPPISLGKEIGFLPGSLDEKLAPWMQPIVDNLDFLTGDAMGDQQKDDHRRHGGGPKSSWADLRGMGLLEVEAINYIRGRSIPHQFMVVDEAQNLTPHEVKTIVTRVGEGTKIVFTGDPYQIDNPYVDAESNGLTWLAERLKGQALVGHMTLTRGERSPLAELAANML
jgi:PhoH-like ATPase